MNGRPRTLDRLAVVINGKPKPFDRTGGVVIDSTTGKPRRLNPVEYRRWKTSAAELIAGTARWRAFPEGTPLAVTVDVYADRVAVEVTPLGTSRRPHDVRGDLDNYAKAILDALQASKVIDDDRQVHHLVAMFHRDPAKPANRTRGARRQTRSNP